jgi:hypothetical protein
MHSPKGSGPGLNDDLTDKMHRFMDGPATHRESHSKYLPDVTVSIARVHAHAYGRDSRTLAGRAMKWIQQFLTSEY